MIKDDYEMGIGRKPSESATAAPTFNQGNIDSLNLVQQIWAVLEAYDIRIHKLEEEKKSRSRGEFEKAFGSEDEEC
jgi:acyl carrier protein